MRSPLHQDQYLNSSEQLSKSQNIYTPTIQSTIPTITPKRQSHDISQSLVRTRSSKKRNIDKTEFVKPKNLEKLNKKADSRKIIKNESNNTFTREEIKTLDDIISSQALDDFLDLN